MAILKNNYKTYQHEKYFVFFVEYQYWIFKIIESLGQNKKIAIATLSRKKGKIFKDIIMKIIPKCNILLIDSDMTLKEKKLACSDVNN